MLDRSYLLLSCCLILTACVVLPITTAWAVPANERAIEFAQPDGTTFQARLVGDEYHAFHETADGKKIVRNPKTKSWEYAMPTAVGSLEPSGKVVGRDVPPAIPKAVEADYLDSVRSLVMQKRKVEVKSPHSRKMTAPSGTIPGLILLVNFSDTSTTFLQSDFTGLMNTVGYNANSAHGSFRDYYLEVSYGNLTVNTTVVGWFTLPNNRAFYGGNTGGPGTDVRRQQLIIDALNAADPTVNFSNYDQDGDGWIDFFGVIHQGQGEEQTGAHPDCMWSHRGTISTYTTGEGILVGPYHTDPEMYYSRLTTVGVICHESGHFFGLPDLYDIDGSSEGIGHWGLMGSGSWCGPGNDGSKPSHFCAWSKICLGWITPTEITAYTNNFALPAVDTNATAAQVFIDDYKDGEFFLIENRYQRSTASDATGFDEYLPGSGALITHVDDYMITNATDVRRKVDVEEADGLGQLDSGTNRGDAGDVYTAPGQVFNDLSNPDAKENTGTATGILVTDFQGAGTASMTCDITPKSLNSMALAYDLFGAGRISTGYGDGDDYAAVRFTTTVAGDLERVKIYCPYKGSTLLTVKIYDSTGWAAWPKVPLPNGSVPPGSAAQGYVEIPLPTPISFGPATDFYVEVRYQYSGGSGNPIALSDDYTDDDRSYVNSDATTYSYFPLTAAGGWPYDVAIRADINTSTSAVEEWMLY